MCNLNLVGQLLRITLGLLLIALAWFGPQTSILSVEWMKLWMLGWFGFLPSCVNGVKIMGITSVGNYTIDVYKK